MRDWAQRAIVYEVLAANTLQTAEIMERYDIDGARRLRVEAGHMRASAKMCSDWAKESLAPPTMGLRS